jgi:hypothetical protein
MRTCRTSSFLFGSRWSRWSISFLLGMGITLASSIGSWAQSPESAPPELKTLLTQMETAASQKDIKKVMEFYSPNFKNSDGLNYGNLQKALSRFWKNYQQVQYKTELQSWERTGNETIAQTLTTVTGTSEQQGRKLQLQSTIESRQFFQEGKLVRQEILSEKTQITSGNKPPQVEVVLPQTVKVGEDFEFDAIVQEPLGGELLAGAALDEKIEGDRYLKPSTLELELLQAGGLFKKAKAPSQPGTRWLSAILVRSDGMTMVTQRIKVEP